MFSRDTLIVSSGLWNGMQFLGHSQTSGMVSHLIEIVILSKRPLCTQIYMLSVPTLILWFALGLSVSLCSVVEALNRDGQYGVFIIFLMNLRINKITFVQIKLFFGKLYQSTKSMHVVSRLRRWTHNTSGGGRVSFYEYARSCVRPPFLMTGHAYISYNINKLCIDVCATQAFSPYICTPRVFLKIWCYRKSSKM